MSAVSYEGFQNLLLETNGNLGNGAGRDRVLTLTPKSPKTIGSTCLVIHHNRTGLPGLGAWGCNPSYSDGLSPSGLQSELKATGQLWKILAHMKVKSRLRTELSGRGLG